VYLATVEPTHRQMKHKGSSRMANQLIAQGPGLAKRPRLEVEGRIRRTTVTIVNSEEGGVNLAIGGRLGLDRCFGVESRVLGSWREGKDGRVRVLHG
jgi:hypothetical protein